MKRFALSVFFLALALTGASCGGSTGLTSSAVSGATCKHAASLDDAGVGACGLGQALVDCENASTGIGCSCVSDTATRDAPSRPLRPGSRSIAAPASEVRRG